MVDSNSSGSALEELNSELEAFIHSDTAVGISFLCSFVATCISAFTIYKHLVLYSSPTLQKNIIRILFIVPFYAILSWFSLLFPDASLYLDSIRDVWEAFVVYCFLSLMLEYCGGENSCVSVIMNHPGAISHCWPFRYCFPEIPLNARFMRTCKQWTIQFVVIKPIMAIMNVVLLIIGHYDDHAYQIVLLVVYNLSYTAALYSLLLFYFATHEHPGLKSKNPILKFLSVKMVVFATYYQGLAVATIPGVSTESLALWNNFILCCEMVIFAILHVFAFHWREFGGAALKSSKMNRDLAFSNARHVMSMTDVANDAYHNFNSKYGSHVLLETDTEYVVGDEGGASQHPGNRDRLASDASVDILEVGDSAKKKQKKKFKTKSYLFGNLRDLGSMSMRASESDVPTNQLHDRIEGFGDTSAMNVTPTPESVVARRNSFDAAIEEAQLDKPALVGSGSFSNPFVASPMAQSAIRKQHDDTHETHTEQLDQGWADFSEVELTSNGQSSKVTDIALV